MIEPDGMQSELRIAFLGNRGFPYKVGAETSRLHLLAKGLSENSCKVLIIISRGFKTDKNLSVTGHNEKVVFIYSNGRVKRPDNLVLRAINIIQGAIVEIFLLRKKKIQAVIINSRSFWQVLHYWSWSKILGYKMFLNYVEYNSQLRGRKKNIFKRINDSLFENYIFWIVQGVFPISKILTNVALKSNPGLHYMKVPVLVDFSKFGKVRKSVGDYFAYCSHASYYYVFEFVIRSFELIGNPDVRLKLITYGKQDDMKRLKDLIESSTKKSQIDILSDLSYNDLVDCFSGAIGLLIPLKPFLKDEARFPHKIGEYTAASRPIISTSFGEIRNYFTDGENALIAERFDVKLFAEKMEFAMKNPDLMVSVGRQGNFIGRTYFDYRVNAKRMRQFMDQIMSTGSLTRLP